MAISVQTFGNGAAGSAAFSGSWNANDVIFLNLMNSGGTTVPNTPSGYTSITSGTEATGGTAERVVWKAAAGGDTMPTLTNCTSVAWVIYAGVNTTAPAVQAAGQAGSSNSMASSGIVAYQAPGVDWVVVVATGKGITGNIGSHPPTSMTSRTEYKTGSDNNVFFDSNGALSSYGFNTKTLDASVSWITKTFELVAASDSTPSPNVSDTITTSESVKLEVDSFINKSDNVTVSESLDVLRDSSRDINKSDSITVAESIVLVLESFINVNDSLTVTELITKLLESYVNKFESMTLSEAIKVEPESFISKSDSVTVGESSTVFIPILNVVLTESISLTESVSLNILVNINVSDSITINENIVIAISCEINKSESINIIDSPSISLVSDINKSETIAVSESQSVLLVSDVLSSESISVTESKLLDVPVSINFNQAVVVGESITVIIAGSDHQIIVSESIGIGEVYTLQSESVLAVNESILITENIQILAESAVQKSETISLTESLIFSVTYSIVTNDSIGIAESISFGSGSGVTSAPLRSLMGIGT